MSPRGDFIDVGGRRLRTVIAGPAGEGPLVVLIHGSFGCASDWAVVQQRLAELGLRSLAWDRAGMGFSDPAPSPRDSRAVVADLDALLERMGETGPLVLVGHSMAGLFVRCFALTHPERTAGLVLVDAVTADLIERLEGAAGIRAYGRSLRWVQAMATIGLMRPLSLVIGDRIGLPREASGDKRRVFGQARHARTSAQEVEAWADSARQAVGEHAPDLPVAVIIAGAGMVVPRTGQDQLAAASRLGNVEIVRGAGHADLLGHRHAGAIVRGVQHVLSAGS